MRIRLGSLCALILLLSFCQSELPEQEGVIRTDSGSISGVLEPEGSIQVFRGIPFAAPPVGENRWRPPGPVAPWDGVLVADQFPSACMQPSRQPDPLMRPPDGPVSEDCLYLNVWTPTEPAAEPLPVLVWIHGGGNRHGTASMVHYNGTNLACQGIVVVSLNYRLGVLGFLPHPELTAESENKSSGNYALLDQLAALRWVKKNIAAFGGDPNRVTICGQSAGSTNVRSLMASPLAKGLFHGVIGQSGGLGGRRAVTLAEAEPTGVAFMKSVGAASLVELRQAVPETLFKGEGRFRPVVDGWVLPEDPYQVYAEGRQNNVPVLVGSNADEGATRSVLAKTEFVKQVQSLFGGRADAYLELYPADSEEVARASQYAAAGDRTFSGMRTWARLVSQAGSEAYLYRFSRVPPLPEGALPPNDPRSSERQGLGAYHGAELVYVFGTLDTRNWPWIKADYELSEMMTSYWANFTKHGNPNGEGLPVWDPFEDDADDVAMNLGDSVGMETVPRSQALNFHEKRD